VEDGKVTKKKTKKKSRSRRRRRVMTGERGWVEKGPKGRNEWDTRELSREMAFEAGGE
jgi:hypothetical protein